MSPDLGAVLASLAPSAGAPLAAAFAGLLDGLLDGSPSGPNPGGARRSQAARSIVAALVAAGARGAELWLQEASLGGGWRRLAGAGAAVPDAERHVRGCYRGFPGDVAVVRSAGLALVSCGGLPGSDERERHQDLAETLLALATLLEADSEDTQGGRDEPGGPLRAA